MYSKKEIIVIDFDETLYKKDSLIEFCKFIYLQKPLQIWAVLIKVYASVLYFFKIINTKRYKELFLYFLHGIPESQVFEYAEKFWNSIENINFNKRILEIVNLKEYRIICISASPELYLKPIMDRFDIEYLGTKITYNNNSYAIAGENCKGEEKVNRLKEYLKEETIQLEVTYSDSLSDKPLFLLSKKAYLVDKYGEPKLITF